MDVVFEEVEEGVVDEGDGAVDVALDAEVEFKWAPGFVAGWEGRVEEVALGVGHVLAFAAREVSSGLRKTSRLFVLTLCGSDS